MVCIWVYLQNLPASASHLQTRKHVTSSCEMYYARCFLTVVLPEMLLCIARLLPTLWRLNVSPSSWSRCNILLLTVTHFNPILQNVRRQNTCDASSTAQIPATCHFTTKLFPWITELLSLPLGYGKISATRVTKSETSVFGISAMLKCLVVTCIRGSLYSTAVRCFMSGHWPGHP